MELVHFLMSWWSFCICWSLTVSHDPVLTVCPPCFVNVATVSCSSGTTFTVNNLLLKFLSEKKMILMFGYDKAGKHISERFRCWMSAAVDRLRIINGYSLWFRNDECTFLRLWTIINGLSLWLLELKLVVMRNIIFRMLIKITSLINVLSTICICTVAYRALAMC